MDMLSLDEERLFACNVCIDFDAMRNVFAEYREDMTDDQPRKLREAKAYLGENWIGHPEYKFNPRHSNNPDIYGPARQDFLLDICFAAADDRDANPAFIRANQIRKALAG